MFWLTLALLILDICFLVLTAIKLKKKSLPEAAGLVIKSLVVYSVVMLAVMFLRLDVPYYLLWLGLLILWLNGFVGYGLNKFNTSKHFDTGLHFCSTFTSTLITYCIIRSFVTEGGSRLFRALFIWAIGGFIGAAFEISEFFHDRKKGMRTQHGLHDTDTDLIADLSGGLLAAVFAFFFILTSV